MAVEDTQLKKTPVTLMCEAIVEAGLTAKSGNTETIVKQMRPADHMALTCGTTFTDALGKMVERKHVISLYTMRCFAGMQPENLWRVCNYMASPTSTVPGFQKLAKELRAGELWWYHFGHPDMPVERMHPSRRMLLPCKPLPFVVIPMRWAATTWRESLQKRGRGSRMSLWPSRPCRGDRGPSVLADVSRET